MRPSAGFVHMNNPPPTACFQVLLPDAGASLSAPDNATLLATLLAAGQVWPASCRNGSCRACRGILEKGTVRYGVEWPGLLPEERAQGAVLPCVAYPTSDLTLRPPND